MFSLTILQDVKAIKTKILTFYVSNAGLRKRFLLPVALKWVQKPPSGLSVGVCHGPL
jgi:hypothetical protein